MDLVILEKIGPIILNGLGYIGHLKKKSGNSSKKIKSFVKSIVTEDQKL